MVEGGEDGEEPAVRREEAREGCSQEVERRPPGSADAE
jgi:hypothetical protein